MHVEEPVIQPEELEQPTGGTGSGYWKTIRVSYIVPFLEELDELPNPKGKWVASVAGIESHVGRAAGRLSATPDNQRRLDGGKPSPMSSNILGAPIQRALGRGLHSSSVVRENWEGQKEITNGKVTEWTAERICFSIGDNHRKFLVIHVDIEPDIDIESLLTKAKHDGKTTSQPGALSEILEIVQPEIDVRRDGGLLTPAISANQSLASRFLISTVTTAVPRGPGNPPSLRFLDGYRHWGSTSDLRWSYFLATHQIPDRRLPPDTVDCAGSGFVRMSGAYDVRVEPFGTSVVFTDKVPEAWWDQLRIFNSGANPFVDLALLSYWQHTCLEYFTDELAKQAHPKKTGQTDLKDSLEALRRFGDDYFFFRNCIWFDSVPNQPVWTRYLRELQDTMGDREALSRLAGDYEDWTNHLGNRVALEDEERKSFNETRVKVYSAIAALAGVVFALLTILVEPASSIAIKAGIGASVCFLILVTGAWFFLRRNRKRIPRRRHFEARPASRQG